MYNHIKSLKIVIIASILLIHSQAFAISNSRKHPGEILYLGHWIEKGWEQQDPAISPAIREWGFSAPWDFTPDKRLPSSNEEYPWGYTAYITKVGRQCIASEYNASPGGTYIRYQRVLPAYYCQ